MAFSFRPCMKAVLKQPQSGHCARFANFCVREAAGLRLVHRRFCRTVQQPRNKVTKKESSGLGFFVSWLFKPFSIISTPAAPQSRPRLARRSRVACAGRRHREFPESGRDSLCSRFFPSCRDTLSLLNCGGGKFPGHCHRFAKCRERPGPGGAIVIGGLAARVFVAFVARPIRLGRIIDQASVVAVNRQWHGKLAAGGK